MIAESKLKSKSKYRFIRLPLFDGSRISLGLYDRIVYGFLLFQDNLDLVPKTGKIAKCLEISPRAAKNAIAALVAKGLLDAGGRVLQPPCGVVLCRRLGEGEKDCWRNRIQFLKLYVPHRRKGIDFGLRESAIISVLSKLRTREQSGSFAYLESVLGIDRQKIDLTPLEKAGFITISRHPLGFTVSSVSEPQDNAEYWNAIDEPRTNVNPFADGSDQYYMFQKCQRYNIPADLATEITLLAISKGMLLSAFDTQVEDCDNVNKSNDFDAKPHGGCLLNYRLVQMADYQRTEPQPLPQPLPHSAITRTTTAERLAQKFRIAEVDAKKCLAEIWHQITTEYKEANPELTKVELAKQYNATCVPRYTAKVTRLLKVEETDLAKAIRFVLTTF